MKKILTRDIIEKIALEAGVTKKMAAEILRAIPGIIEEGLRKDGEVKVKGLGTFRLKLMKAKSGRNPKTGERVVIPAHNKISFQPEQSLKEFINQPNRMLEYKVLEQTEEIQPEVFTPFTPPPEIKTETHEPSPVDSGYPSSVMHGESEPEFLKEEPELPPKKQIHWIIPVIAAVIILLSLLFYLRNCNRVDESSQQSGIGSQQQEPEIEGAELQDTVQITEPGTLIPEPSTQQSSPITHHSSLTIAEGKHLFKIASEVYGNPYLWVLIYKANPDKITDPGQIFTGSEIIIPTLEGTKDKLSRNDSLEVAEGYRLVYEFYHSQGDARADDFKRSMERYKLK